MGSHHRNTFRGLPEWSVCGRSVINKCERLLLTNIADSPRNFNVRLFDYNSVKARIKFAERDKQTLAFQCEQSLSQILQT